MHLSIQAFVSGALSREDVEGKVVLEVGSLDVNGSVRPAIESLKPSSYLGVDAALGPRVDRVLDVADLLDDLGKDYADVVVSTEMLEHVEDWRVAVLNLMAVTKPGGLLVITTRSPGFHYHPFPEDRWRYSVASIRKILEEGGFHVLSIVSDPQAPGVFVKARKPSTWVWNGNDPVKVWLDCGVEAVPQATSGLAECDVIIPTFNNPNQLGGLLYSLFREMDAGFKGRIIVVNNGHTMEKSEDPRLVIINVGTNLGWTGGLALGLTESTAPYVIFANDDTFIPESSRGATLYMLREIVADETVGAVGPSTNICIGGQRMETQTPTTFDAPFLVFFFTMFRRSAIDAVGGVDTAFVTADDMDLSLRLRKAGHRLLVRKDVYVHHYAFQTGIRVYGDHTKPGGWNSQKMLDDAMAQLQAKHGEDALDFLSLRLRAPQ